MRIAGRRYPIEANTSMFEGSDPLKCLTGFLDKSSVSAIPRHLGSAGRHEKRPHRNGQESGDASRHPPHRSMSWNSIGLTRSDATTRRERIIADL